MPSRIQSTTPAVSSGGGGTSTAGTFQWGSDFGEGSGTDDTSILINPPVADLEAVSVMGGAAVAVLPDHDVAAVMTGPSVVPAVDGTASGPPFWQSVSESNPTTQGTNITVTKPTGTIQGDLMIAHISRSALNATFDITAPSGWTLIQGAGSPGTAPLHSGVWWKIAGASEPADYTWSWTGQAVRVGEIHRFRGAHATTPIDASAVATLNATGLDPDPDSPGLTVGFANCYVMALLGHHHLASSQTHTPNFGQAELSDHQGTNGTNFVGQHTQSRVHAAGGLGTIAHDCTETVATDAVMIRVSIRPAASLDLTP